MRKTYTYGEVPDRTIFEYAYAEELSGESYEITHPRSLISKLPTRLQEIVPIATRGGKNIVLRLTCDDLYEVVTDLARAWTEGDGNSGDWAASILTTLGFEWI